MIYKLFTLFGPLYVHTYELAPNSTAAKRFGAAASRILVGAPARQPDLVRASRKTDGGAVGGLYE